MSHLQEAGCIQAEIHELVRTAGEFAGQIQEQVLRTKALTREARLVNSQAKALRLRWCRIGDNLRQGAASAQKSPLLLADEDRDSISDEASP